jgi:hypothetical protein
MQKIWTQLKAHKGKQDFCKIDDYRQSTFTQIKIMYVPTS